MSDYVEQPSRERVMANGSVQDIRSWEGPEDQLAAFLLSELPVGWAEYEKTKEQWGWITLTATYNRDVGEPREPVDPDYGLIERVWEREANDIESPIMGHNRVSRHDPPLTIEGVRGLGDVWNAWPGYILAAVEQYKSDLKAAIKAGDSIPTMESYSTRERPDAATDEEFELAISLFEWLARSDTMPTFPETQYVLRKSDRVTSWSTLHASSENVGRLLTYSSLVASEPTLPAAVLINAAGLQDWWWLKKEPRVREVSGGNFQITQEYWSVWNALWWVYGPLL